MLHWTKAAGRSIGWEDYRGGGIKGRKNFGREEYRLGGISTGGSKGGRTIGGRTTGMSPNQIPKMLIV